jgi:hypothetical protein
MLKRVGNTENNCYALSGNHIQHIDSTMLAATLKLMTLSLANNRLTILPDNVFMGLGSLLRLDLSANPIRQGTN